MERVNASFELYLDGQSVGRFAAASGLEDESDEVHLPGLRRAFIVELAGGEIDDEYADWLEYGRRQVGKHGEIVGPDRSGSATRWLFEEAWPTGTTVATPAAPGRIGLARLVIEIEGVRTRAAPEAAPRPAAAAPPGPEATGREPERPASRGGREPRGFWRRLFGRR